MALYNISFEVSRDTVTPDTPQRAGRYGDKEQTVVTLKPTFDGVENYQYRLEITDGAGGYDVTELMKPANGVITYTIPAAWTHPGIAILRLIAVQLDENYNETERFHCPPAYLLFENRDNGEQLWSATDTAWQAVMGRALGVSLEAETAALVAKSAATEAGENAAAAEQFCEQAREIAENAQETAEEARSISGVAKDSAESAATSAAEAAAAAVDARSAAQSAVQDATAAGVGYAVRAETAATRAELAEDSCQDTLEQVEELSGIAEDIRGLAGEGDAVWYPCVTVDTALDSTSGNPLANHAVAAALGGKANADHVHAADAVTFNNDTDGFPYLTGGSVHTALGELSSQLFSHLHTAGDVDFSFNDDLGFDSGSVDIALNALAQSLTYHEHWASAIPCNAGGYTNVEYALSNLYGQVENLTSKIADIETQLEDIKERLTYAGW